MGRERQEVQVLHAPFGAGGAEGVLKSTKSPYAKVAGDRLAIALRCAQFYRASPSRFGDADRGWNNMTAPSVLNGCGDPSGAGGGPPCPRMLRAAQYGDPQSLSVCSRRTMAE